MLDVGVLHGSVSHTHRMVILHITVSSAVTCSQLQQILQSVKEKEPENATERMLVIETIVCGGFSERQFILYYLMNFVQNNN